jgi:hypothetical protein
VITLQQTEVSAVIPRQIGAEPSPSSSGNQKHLNRVEAIGACRSISPLNCSRKRVSTQIIFDAVKDAMLVAARKRFKTTENMSIDFNERATSNST